MHSPLDEYFIPHVVLRKSMQFFVACLLLICCVPVMQAQISFDDLRAQVANGNVEAQRDGKSFIQLSGRDAQRSRGDGILR